MELLISNTGEIMLKSLENFPSEVTRVEFFVDTRLLVIGLADLDFDSQLLEVEVDEQLIPSLRAAGRVFVVAVDAEDKPQQGFDVPLISIGV